jgi:hypothetical protein
MVDEHDVRRTCLAMPGVTERLSWDRPAWFAKSMMARMWDDGVVTVKTDERQALAAADPATYFWTPHHQRSELLLLVRLDHIGKDELDELLAGSFRLASGRGRARP